MDIYETEVSQVSEVTAPPARKRLFLFSHVSNARHITGAEKLLLFLAKRLSAHFECTLVAPREGRLTDLARKSGIGSLLRETPLLYGMCFPHPRLLDEANEIMQGDPAGQIVQLLVNERPDYVFVNTCVNIVPAMAAKKLGIPVIWQITEIMRETESVSQAVEIIDRYSDRIVGISETVLRPFHGTPAEAKLSLLFPSWDNGDVRSDLWPQLRRNKRRDWEASAGDTVVGYISSYLTAEKGSDHFIEAALAVEKAFPRAKFAVIGGEMDRGYYRKLRDKAEAIGRGRVIFVDHEEDIAAAYGAMDLVVIPSLITEGFGMTAMEAMVFGKPVIAYASGGLEEIMFATDNGAYLVPAGDIAGLAAKLAELLASPEMRELVGRSNRERVEAAFGPAAYMARFEEFVGRIGQLEPGLVIRPEVVESGLPLAVSVPEATGEASDFAHAATAKAIAAPGATSRALRRASARNRRRGARSATRRRSLRRLSAGKLQRRAGASRRVRRATSRGAHARRTRRRRRHAHARRHR